MLVKGVWFPTSRTRIESILRDVLNQISILYVDVFIIKPVVPYVVISMPRRVVFNQMFFGFDPRLGF